MRKLHARKRQGRSQETMKRKKDTVEVYSEWREMTATKFETVAVTGNMIKDYKGHFESQFKTAPH